MLPTDAGTLNAVQALAASLSAAAAAAGGRTASLRASSLEAVNCLPTDYARLRRREDHRQHHPPVAAAAAAEAGQIHRQQHPMHRIQRLVIAIVFLIYRQ